MLKRLECTPETDQMLSHLTKVYQVGCWASFGVCEFPFSGYYTEDGKEPLVWYYDDHNGVYEDYTLIPISNTTTGSTICWTFNKATAQKLADALQLQQDTRRNICN